MKKTALIPDGVNVEVDGFKVNVSGKNGNLERDFYSQLYAKKIKVIKEDKMIAVSTELDKRKIKSSVGTIASHIRNMIHGVTEGYTRKLKIAYVHFPMTVKVEGKKVIISNFLGERINREADILGDCKVEVKKDIVTVTGVDKEEVMQTAANIEVSTKISGRDRRVYQDGVFVLK